MNGSLKKMKLKILNEDTKYDYAHGDYPLNIELFSNSEKAEFNKLSNNLLGLASTKYNDGTISKTQQSKFDSIVNG